MERRDLLEVSIAKKNVNQCLVDYLSIPSLLETAVVTLVSSLWQASSIRELHAAVKENASLRRPKGLWDEAEQVRQCFNMSRSQVEEKLAALGLPKVLKHQAERVIVPIGTQIFKWFGSDGMNMNDGYRYVESICWTPLFTIHESGTAARILNKHHAMYIIDKFKIAANACMEKHVMDLWGEMSEGTKRALFSSLMRENYTEYLIIYWVFVCNGDLEGLSHILPTDYYEVNTCNPSLYGNMFSFSVNMGRASGVEYFWPKLTDEEKYGGMILWIGWALEEQCLRYGPANNYSMILCFLLSNLQDMKQANEIFSKYSKKLLFETVCRWPLQKFASSTVWFMGESLPEEFYIEFLKELHFVIEPNTEADDILSDVWSRSPTRLQNSLIRYVSNSEGFFDLFEPFFFAEREKAIEIILNGIEASERRAIVCNAMKNGHITSIIENGNFMLLDEVLRKTLVLESDIKAAKKVIAETHGTLLCVKWAGSGFNIIRDFFDWCFSDKTELDAFMVDGIDKMCVGACLFNNCGLEALDNFVRWCHGSQKEAASFKKRFAITQSVFLIYEFGHRGWPEFKKFLLWAFKAKGGVRAFRTALKTHEHCILSETPTNKKFIRKLKWWLNK